MKNSLFLVLMILISAVSEATTYTVPPVIKYQSTAIFDDPITACNNWAKPNPLSYHDPHPSFATLASGGTFFGFGYCNFSSNPNQPNCYSCVSRIWVCPSNYTFTSPGVCASYTKPFAEKSIGCGPCESPLVGNPVQVGTGNKTQIENDYISGGNFPLEFTRFYNSFNARNDSLGKSWSHSYLRAIDTTSSATTVFARRANGKLLLFTMQNGVWLPDADISDQLSQQLDSAGNISGWVFRDVVTDEVETYNATGKLISILGRRGNGQNLVYSTASTPSVIAPIPNLLIEVNDFSGRKLSFTYDGNVRIKTVTDPNGGIFYYGYDTNAGLASVTFPDGKIRTYKYNDFGSSGGSYYLLTGIVDENNNRFASYSYSNQRVLTTQHNVGGIAVEKYIIAYNANGNATVQDANNTIFSYAFQTVLGVPKNTSILRNCTAGTSGCSGSKTISYDANGSIASKTDFNGNITNYGYDLARNLETSRTEAYGIPQARTITTQWHTTYRLPTLITEPGKTTAFTYDTSGNLLTKTITDTALSKSRTWTYTYNSLGQVLTADGPRTDVLDITTNTYYASASSVAGGVHSIGDLATVTNALGQVTSITNYDLNGRPLTITDPNDVVTTLTYDPRGRLKTRTVANTQTTTYDYDGVGQLTKVTLPDTSYLSYTYDTAHRLTDITDNTGNKTHYTLDAMSNRIQEDTKDPSGNILKTRSRIFDALNRLQKDVGGTTPTTQITQYGYDNNGNLKTVTDPLNHTTTNGYDALNRLITVTDPANGVATTTYSALDQVTQVKDPRLVTTDYTINALGDVTLTTSPDSGNTNKVYDLAGNVIQKTDARGVVSNYTYDALNRVTSITYPASTAENVSFTYDSVANGNKGKGRLTGYSNDGGATLLTYDTYGNIVQQTEMVGSQFYVTAYQYDAANRMAKITYPSGRIVSYIRNAVGQITQVQLQASVGAILQTLISGVTYQPFGPVSSLTFGNGVSTTIQYDKDYRFTRRTTSAIQGIDVSYGYDAAGNITQLTDAVGGTYTKSFGYDLLSRLTTDNNDVGQMQYQYDANGNRTNLTATYPNSTSNVMPIQYGAQSNRMTTLQGTSMGYDAAGNITSYMGGTLKYTYNNANRASALSSNNGSSIHIIGEYTYNALGRLTQNTADQHYVYLLDGKYLAVNQFASGTPVERTEYVYLDDMPVAQLQDSLNSSGAIVSTVTTYIHTDHLNTPRALTDRIGNVVWRWEGDAFGVAAPQLGLDVDGNYDELALRFPGQISNGGDPFFYNMNRNYDSLTGRYTQSDPIGLNGGLNTYGYVEGNPVSLIDPSGLFASSCTASPQAAILCGEAGAPGVAATANAAGAAATLAATQNCSDDCKALEADVDAKALEVRRQYYRGLADPNDLYNQAFSVANLGKRKGTWLGHIEKFNNAKKALANAIGRAEAKGCHVDSWDKELLNLNYPSKPAAR